VLTVPIKSVTTRLPKKPDDKAGKSGASSTTNTSPATGTNSAKPNEGRKPGEAPKPIEVVFIVDGDHAKMVPVKRGISDDSWVEITEGLQEGQEVVSGGYKAINRELEDGKKIKKGPPIEDEKEKEKENP
jgi:HlyD family secretion protein